VSILGPGSVRHGLRDRGLYSVNSTVVNDVNLVADHDGSVRV
jgi:hypothetical protein